MNDGHFSFASLISGRDEYEESFWPSFTDIMMVITMIFLLVTVAVVLTNTRLLDELRKSIMAESTAKENVKQAKQLAEFRLKENATLEEQLDYLQQRSASLEMELLRSRAEAEQARDQLSNRDTALERLQAREKEASELLAGRDQSLNNLQTLLADKNAQSADLQNQVQRLENELTNLHESVSIKDEETAALRSQAEKSTSRLLSLQGEYDDLDKKYQKLLKPARSPKNKQVVEVIYQKGGYRFRKPGEANYTPLSREALDQQLGALKTQLGTDLYVKIIIPENSGLSYNEAWSFTNEMLKRYDYYYQNE